MMTQIMVLCSKSPRCHRRRRGRCLLAECRRFRSQFQLLLCRPC